MYQGDYLHKYLEKVGKKPSYLANLLGVSRQTVYKYYDSENLSRETVNKIVTALKVKERDIFPEAYQPDFIIQAGDQTFVVEMKSAAKETQGNHFENFVISKGFNNTQVAEALGVLPLDIAQYYRLKNFGPELINKIKKVYTDFTPIPEQQESYPNTDTENNIKDLIIENLLDQVNQLKETVSELKDKLAGSERVDKRKHA